MRSCVAFCSKFWGTLVVLALVSISHAEVSFRILDVDGSTPFDDRAIMVGTQLQIIISSDSPDYFSGGFFIKDAQRYNADILPDQKFPASGNYAMLEPWESELYEGCLLGSGSRVQSGDWFSVYYIATEVGDCNVGLYEDHESGPMLISPEYKFSHVKSRDFDSNGRVDLADFAWLAYYWQISPCTGECQEYDLDENGSIDSIDITLFAEYWLEVLVPSS